MKILFLFFLICINQLEAMDFFKESEKISDASFKNNNQKIQKIRIFSNYFKRTFHLDLSVRNHAHDGTLFLNDDDLHQVFETWKSKHNEDLRKLKHKSSMIEHHPYLFFCVGFFGGVVLGTSSFAAFYYKFLKK